jgi:hypothetical protein
MLTKSVLEGNGRPSSITSAFLSSSSSTRKMYSSYNKKTKKIIILKRTLMITNSCLLFGAFFKDLETDLDFKRAAFHCQAAAYLSVADVHFDRLGNADQSDRVRVRVAAILVPVPACLHSKGEREKKREKKAAE